MTSKPNQPPTPLRLTTESDPSLTPPDQDALREQEAIYREALCMTSRLLEMPDMFDLPW